MPTVILLDVSLSMCRPLTTADTSESLQVRQLAVHGINAFLDHMAQHCKLEFCALVVFSSLWELVVPFTRDTESLKAALVQTECHDRTDLGLALQGARQVLLDEWGSSMPAQVILVTDGALGGWRGGEEVAGGPRLHAVCLHPTAPSLGPLGRLAQRTGGRLFLPEGGLVSVRSVQQAFLSLAQAQYAPFHGVLRCGQLWSSVSLCPPPERQDFGWPTIQPDGTNATNFRLVHCCELASVAGLMRSDTAASGMWLPGAAAGGQPTHAVPAPGAAGRVGGGSGAAGRPVRRGGGRRRGPAAVLLRAAARQPQGGGHGGPVPAGARVVRHALLMGRQQEEVQPDAIHLRARPGCRALAGAPQPAGAPGVAWSGPGGGLPAPSDQGPAQLRAQQLGGVDPAVRSASRRAEDPAARTQAAREDGQFLQGAESAAAGCPLTGLPRAA
ncbi:integrator complex subunit 14 isoform X2 [Haemaphysalis longicornis]